MEVARGLRTPASAKVYFGLPASPDDLQSYHDSSGRWFDSSLGLSAVPTAGGQSDYLDLVLWETWHLGTAYSLVNPVDQLSGRQGLRLYNLSSYGKRDEDRPPQRQKMESSSGAGVLAAQTAFLPTNPYTKHSPAPSGMTGFPLSVPNIKMESSDAVAAIPSNLQPFDQPGLLPMPNETERRSDSGQDFEAAQAANILASGAINVQDEQALDAFGYPPSQDLVDQAHAEFARIYHTEDDMLPDSALTNSHISSQVADPQNAKAYAKLVFADGDLFITTHDVMLGRNMDVFEQVKRRKKQERRAQEELDTYRNEPSQPSQPGDVALPSHPSNSSQSLEGRAAPPSNFSEHGGSVWYPAVHNSIDTRPTKPKRRVSYFSKSSSTTSVAPANLHPNTQAPVFTGEGEPEFRTYASFPIHTSIPEDITKVSKQHLHFRFNFFNEQWELLVVGNRAFVNDRLVDRGDLVPLEHNDEIMIASVHMTFKLPDNFRHSPGLSRGTFSRNSGDDEQSDDDEAVSTSPVRRLSNALEALQSESDEDGDSEPEAGADSNRPSIKIKLKSKQKEPKSGKGKKKESATKRPKKQSSSPDQNTEDANKREKSNNPQGSAKELDAPATAVKDGNEPESADQPLVKPGSFLADIPLEHLPERRKGPGRPPKEGNVSKRDAQLANRKKRDYEKRGEEPPPFHILVDEVRRETKAKELQAKLAAGGQLPPGTQVMQSIETDAAVTLPKLAGDSVGVDDNAAAAASAQAEAVRRASPKPKRNIKTPSPMKPESDYTEEQLKKPVGTYVHILDEILRDHPAGRADLQEIYDRIMKRYPYFKYRQSTTGWQSSVRHNLLQNDRFQENGRSGKGKLWAINFDVPLEKEKKRRVTPPPRPAIPNGQFMPGQLTNGPYTQYGNPYGPQMHNGQAMGAQPGHATYHSYGQLGPMGGRQPGNANGYANGVSQPQQHNMPPGGLQANGAAVGPSAQSAHPFGRLVEEIMQYRTEYLAQFTANADAYKEHEKIFVDTTNLLSELYHDHEKSAAIRDGLDSDEKKEVFDRMHALFNKYPPPPPAKADADVGERENDTTAGEVQKAVDKKAEDDEAGGQGGDAGPADKVVNGAGLGRPSASLSTSEEGTLVEPQTAQRNEEETIEAAATGPPAETDAIAPTGTKRVADDDSNEQEAKRLKKETRY